MKYGIQFDTAVGTLTVIEEEGAIVRVGITEKENLEFPEAGVTEIETPCLKQAKKELMEYAMGKRRTFDLPLNPSGTDFQKRVWEALLTIPYGEVRSYGQIAVQAGSPKGSRAVGMANHNNPIGIIIPCHRVIGADGSLTGYGGGLDMKRRLLKLEGYTEIND